MFTKPKKIHIQSNNRPLIANRQVTMLKTYHILNGDALYDFFPEILAGEIIVARECLIDGPLTGENLPQFWETRAQFIAAEYNERKDSYFADVVSEFEKILSIPAGSEINLWFEEDLFCQVNLWFCASLLLQVADSCTLYLIKPPLINGEPNWGGFGALGINGLADAYQTRPKISPQELRLLSKLWKTYKSDDRMGMAELAVTATNFPMLPEVIKAQLDRFSADGVSGRPENALKTIKAELNTTDFKTIFAEFGRREGIYGFGDWQVEKLLKKLDRTTSSAQ